jgi:hypothetical protein
MMKKSSASWKTKKNSIYVTETACFYIKITTYTNTKLDYLYKYEDFALGRYCIKIPYSTKRLSLVCFYIKITTYTTTKLHHFYKYKDFALGHYCIEKSYTTKRLSLSHLHKRLQHILLPNWPILSKNLVFSTRLLIGALL